MLLDRWSQVLELEVRELLNDRMMEVCCALGLAQDEALELFKAQGLDDRMLALLVDVSKTQVIEK